MYLAIPILNLVLQNGVPTLDHNLQYRTTTSNNTISGTVRQLNNICTKYYSLH